MARKIHKHLSYEKKEVAHAKYQLDRLSDICYEIEKVLGKTFLEDKVWTYGCGITFRDTDQDQYAILKGILPRLGRLDKESSEHGIRLQGRCCEDKIMGSKVSLTVSFKWDVPDTCEIITTIVKEKVSGDYFVDDSGDIFHNKTEIQINCAEPVLESVFRKKELASG